MPLAAARRARLPRRRARLRRTAASRPPRSARSSRASAPSAGLGRPRGRARRGDVAVVWSGRRRLPHRLRERVLQPQRRPRLLPGRARRRAACPRRRSRSTGATAGCSIRPGSRSRRRTRSPTGRSRSPASRSRATASPGMRPAADGRHPAARATRVEGSTDDGWSGAAADYTRFRCRGGEVVASVQTRRELFREPQTVRATVGGGRTLDLPRPVGGTRRLRGAAGAAPPTCAVSLRRLADGRARAGAARRRPTCASSACTSCGFRHRP